MKRMTIDAAVRWAYVDELPKARRSDGRTIGHFVPSGWAATERFLDLLATVEPNAYGVVPDLASDDEPSPDAVTVHEAVASLDDLVFDAFDPDVFVADWPDLGALGNRALARAIDRATLVTRDGDRCLRRGLAAVVRRHALLGASDVGCAAVPKRVAVVGPNGRPKWRRRERRPIAWDAAGMVVRTEEIEVDVVIKHGRVPVGAWPVEELQPDPVPVIAARIDWAAAAVGYEMLVERLRGEMRDIVIDEAAIDPFPWIERRRQPRVFTERGWCEPVDMGAPERPIAMRRARRSKISIAEKPQDA